MKKAFAGLLAALLCLGLAACAAGETDGPQEPDSDAVVPIEPMPVSQPVPEKLPDPEPVWTVTEGVAFSLLQDTYPVGTTELTLVIENRSGMEVGWGVWENYEKYVDGQWRELEGMDTLAFRDVLQTLGPESVRTQSLRCLNLLPSLDEGLYRVTGSEVRVGEEKRPLSPWQVTFRIAEDAQPEPDYALYISGQPIPAVEGCAVTDRIPGYFINTTGEDGSVLLIPHLEKLDGDGAWAEVPFREQIGFCGTPDPLPPEGKEWYWEISALWGSLEDGQYRVGVQVQPDSGAEEMVYGEFTLYTPENSAGLPLAPRD